MLVEGVISLIIVAALFLVAPGVLDAVSQTVPTITAAEDAGLNLAQQNIATTASGALNLSSIGLIMMAIGIMIAGFMLIRNYK